MKPTSIVEFTCGMFMDNVDDRPSIGWSPWLGERTARISLPASRSGLAFLAEGRLNKVMPDAKSWE